MTMILGVSRREKMDECCGTCKWHQHESVDDGWVCVNDRSEYCTDWTDYKDYCEDWEGKEGLWTKR